MVNIAVCIGMMLFVLWSLWYGRKHGRWPWEQPDDDLYL